jgi:hypothetical protein
MRQFFQSGHPIIYSLIVYVLAEQQLAVRLARAKYVKLTDAAAETDIAAC